MRFAEFERLIVAFGFRLDRVAGSHRIYKHPDVPRMLNLRPRASEAKPYQIREFIVMVEEHDLKVAE